MAPSSKKPSNSRKNSKTNTANRKRNPPKPNSSRPKPRPRQPSPDADLAPTPAKRTCFSPKQEKLSVVKRYQPPKSFNDPNEYRILELSNGLTVALVSRRRPNPISTSSSSLKTSSAPSYRPFFVPNQGENGFSYNMEDACSYLPPEQFNGGDVYSYSPNGNCRDTSILKCEPTPSPKVDIFGDAWPLHTPYPLPVPIPSYDGSLGCDGGKNGSLLRMNDEPATTPPSFTSIALVVNVGGASDPINCQGLAHFTEHMVHHGSKRHPQEDSQTLLLKNFGNLCNAGTRHQRTTYYHEIMDDLLDKSLDIFSDMLSYPLFEEEHLDREVNAVDNEFHFRRDRNSRDIWMLPFHVTVNENHPLSKFLCGSIETLGNGARVRRFMREFHTEHYVAPAMTACLNSTKSLDELETLALDHFSRFLEGERNTFQKMWNKCEPVVWRNCDKKVVLQGITKSAMLDFWWHLPASLFTEEPNEMILEMILAMLTDTSDKSLRHHLQHMGLVWDQRFSRFDTSYAAFIRINFHLTEKGRANTSKIFQATFQFLEKLQTTSESEMRRLFEELRWKNQRQFHFGTQYSSLYHTIQLATALQFVSDKQELVTYGSWANARFNYGRIIKSLQQFRDENLIVLEIIPKGFSIEDWAASKNYTDFKVERAPHTNTPYLLVPRKDDNFVANMNNAAIPSQFNFGFIPVNNFLLEDMKLQHGRGDGDASMHPPINYGGIQPQNLKCRGSDNEAFPRILGNHMGHMSESYSPYLANVSVYFCSSTVFTNPRNHILAYLWKFCMNYNHKVNQTALGMGGFDVSFLFNNDGIHIDVVGFPKHMSKVVDTAIASMLKNPISENDFGLAKECLKVNIESLLGNNDVLDRTVCECTIYQNEEMFLDSLHHVESLTFQDLQNYMILFKRTTYAHVILKGNVPVDVFHSVAKSLGQYEFFPYLGNPMEYHQRDPVLKPLFPFGEKCIRVKSECMSGFCTSVNNCYILGPINNDQANCLLSALDFMDCQAFLYLRTKHQLGYSVCVSRKEFLLPNVLMFSVKVMATAKKFSPCELDIKIDEFLAYYCDYLKTITEEQFETMRKLVILFISKKNISPDVSLQDVTRCFNSFFGPTTKHKYEGCEKGFAVRDYKNKCFWREIRKLSIQVVGNEEKSCDCDVCNSISGWRPGPEIESKLRFATGSGSTSSYFVDNFPRFS